MNDEISNGRSTPGGQPPTGPDAFSHYDGPYLIGALSPEDRTAYEQHLTQCPHCTAAVRELAGMPSLLARVPVESADRADGADRADPPDPDLPDALLPALLTRVRRRRRRTRAIGAAGSILAAGALAGGVLVGANSLHTEDSPMPGVGVDSASPPSAEAMLSVADTAPVSADARIVQTDWGTRVIVTCRYVGRGSNPGGTPGTAGRTYRQSPSSDPASSFGATEESAPPPAASSPAANPDRATTGYVLVLIHRSGRREQIASWHSRAGRSDRVEAATATQRSRIRMLEIRTASGTAVLRLTLPVTRSSASPPTSPDTSPPDTSPSNTSPSNTSPSNTSLPEPSSPEPSS